MIGVGNAFHQMTKSWLEKRTERMREANLKGEPFDEPMPMPSSDDY